MAPPEEVAAVDELLRLTADEENLYVHHVAGIRAFPTAGGSARDILTTTKIYDPMVLGSGAFFGVERGGRKDYTVTLPSGGGAVQRLGESIKLPTRVVTNGSRFVGSLQTTLVSDVEGATLVDGDLADPAAASALAITPPWKQEGGTSFASVRTWDANATDIYLGYEGVLYRIPRPE